MKPSWGAVIFLFWSGAMACRFIPDNPDGARLYAEKCASCHGTQGEGLRQLIPPINDLRRLQFIGDSLPCLLRYGISASPARGQPPMPAFPELEADDVAALWGHLFSMAGQPEARFTLADVRRSGCMD